MLKEVKQAQKSLKKAAGYVTMSWFTNTHTLFFWNRLFTQKRHSHPVVTQWPQFSEQNCRVLSYLSRGGEAQRGTAKARQSWTDGAWHQWGPISGRHKSTHDICIRARRRITTPPGSQHYRVAHLWPRYNNKINVNDLLSPLFTLEMTSYHFSVFFLCLLHFRAIALKQAFIYQNIL